MGLVLFHPKALKVGECPVVLLLPRLERSPKGNGRVGLCPIRGDRVAEGLADNTGSL